MSEPVTNVEIEDVLSSIRRLVSSEDREERKQADADKDAEANKLVLSPSQRVDESEPASGAAEPPQSEEDRAKESHSTGRQDASEDEDAADTGVFRDDALAEEPREQAGDSEAHDDRGDGTAELAAGVPDAQDQPDDEVSAETGDAGETRAFARPEAAKPSEGADALDVDADEDVGAASPEQDDAFADAAETGDAGDDAQDDPETVSGLEAKIAGVEAAVAATDDEWEPDGSSEDDYSGGPVETMAWEDYSDQDGRDQARQGSAPVMADETADDPAEPDVEDDDGSDPFDPAEEVAGFAFVESNDEEETGEYIGEEAPDVQAETSAEAAGDATGDGAEDADAWYSDDAILDEDTLRDMVSEIVREELQGALGERITRNVRKLVRREIHRALMSQELD